MTDSHLVDMIPSYCHIDGPHTDDTVTDATSSLSELVRYLNHATIGRNPWRWASTTHRVVGGLSATVYGMEQLVRQLAQVLAAQAESATLYDDRRDRPGADTAIAAAMEMQALQLLIGQLASALDAVRAHTVHLGNND
ncbi:hypothetical protein [Amycolatopsis sp. cmx-4-83]|uniref:hypothetical protein n=1 Tax=Amycolatopsis sp. cmx-4-83 TaxID=2790940 RepID=UPI00397D1DEB